jgi:TPR repeat protein
MLKKLLLTIVLTLSISILSITAVGQEIKPASESEQSILHRSEVIDLIRSAKKMPEQQQKKKADELWAAGADSKTPRSDYLYCTALAYLGSLKGQACLARAFETSRGIVGDYTDAYVWYTIALEHAGTDAGLKKEIQAGQARAQQMLHSSYPSPSDFELEDAIKQQKEKIKEYAAEAGK